MAQFSNSQKMAAVLSEWVRPVISQLASSKLMEIPALQSLQMIIGSTGLVGQGYDLSADISPLIQPIVNAMITPMLTRFLANVPDEAIPATARAIVDKMKEQGQYKILNGMVTFERSDIDQLDDLLRKNLPVEDSETYSVIH